MRVARRKIIRTIFPALLDRFDRHLLNTLAANAKCSRSAIVRRLILKEVAQQRVEKVAR